MTLKSDICSISSFVMLRFELIHYAFKISGRVRYKFASFWNRNNALRGLQKAVKNYHAIVEAEKKVKLFRVYQIISKRVKCNELNELLRIKIIQTNPIILFLPSFGVQEKEQSALRAHSSSVRGGELLVKVPKEAMVKSGKNQPFIKEEVLSGIYNVSIVSQLCFRYQFLY